MLLSFKTMATDKKFFLKFAQDNCVRCEAVFVRQKSDFGGRCPMPAANIHACKVEPSPSKNCFICFNESSSKMMKSILILS